MTTKTTTSGSSIGYPIIDPTRPMKTAEETPTSDLNNNNLLWWEFYNYYYYNYNDQYSSDITKKITVLI